MRKLISATMFLLTLASFAAVAAAATPAGSAAAATAKVEGTVTAIDAVAKTLTLDTGNGTRQFSVQQSTTFLQEGAVQQTLTFADLAVGDDVTVESASAAVGAQAILQAHSVKRAHLDKVEGKVTAVDTKAHRLSVKVNGQVETFEVDRASSVLTKSGDKKLLALKEVRIGDEVTVEFARTGTTKHAYHVTNEHHAKS